MTQGLSPNFALYINIFALSLLRWAIDDIDLPSKSNISKTVRLSIALQKRINILNIRKIFFLKNMLQAFQWYAW